RPRRGRVRRPRAALPGLQRLPGGGRGAGDLAVAGHRAGAADRGAQPRGAGGAGHGGRAGGQGGGGRRPRTGPGGAVRRADALAAEPAAPGRGHRRAAHRRRAGRGAGTVPGRAGQAGRAAAVGGGAHPSVTAATVRVTAVARVESTTASRASSGACRNRVANTNTFCAVGRPDITTAASSSTPSRPSSSPTAYATAGWISTLAATTAYRTPASGPLPSGRAPASDRPSASSASGTAAAPTSSNGRSSAAGGFQPETVTASPATQAGMTGLRTGSMSSPRMPGRASSRLSPTGANTRTWNSSTGM